MSKNSAEIYEACQTMFRDGQTPEGAVVARDEMLVHQTLLLLEIRDLLANPLVQVAPTAPQASPESIYYAAEGHVNLKDFPPGAKVVRCTLEMIRAMSERGGTAHG